MRELYFWIDATMMSNYTLHYRILSNSPNKPKAATDKMEWMLTKILRKMKDVSIINCNFYKQLRASYFIILKLYGVPNVHMKYVPLSPILDINNSPYHLIAKWLQPVKNHINRYNSLGSFDFFGSIGNININGGKMISLDVTSHFTYVPLTETMCFYVSLLKIITLIFVFQNII